jgi:hypothetical protein
MYWPQRLEIGWNSSKILLIRRFLLESPSFILVLPNSPSDYAGSGFVVLYSDKAVSSLEQVLHTRYIESGKMVR